MTPHEIADLRADLLAYTCHMFKARRGSELKLNQHQIDICDALERVVIGHTKRLIINIPPRSGKTEIAVKSFISWCMGNWPHSEFIHTSYSQRLAASNTYAVRAMMQHEEYQKIFDHTSLMLDSKAKDEFRTEQGGIVYAVGSDGTITGYGAGSMDEGFGGAIVIDDPHKAGEGESEIMREGVISWFQETLESRKNSPDTPIILIMQRLHDRDLSGWLLNGGNGEEWELLKISALDDDRQSFWPEQFPVEMLDRLEQANPYIFAGQYMQEPSPRAGGMFKPHNIEIVDAIPAGLRFTRGWDLAATKNAGDWTVGAKIAVDKEGTVWLADIARERGSPDDVEAMLVGTSRQDGANTRQSIPQDPGQAGKSQKAYLSKKLTGVSFEFSTETGDKATRASPLASQVNVGNVRMVKAPWNDSVINEMRTFPMGSHDDIIDAMSRAYNCAINVRSGVMIARA